MKILKEAYTIPDNVVMFYDRHLRLWTLYIKDEEGNQISNTEYAPSRTDAIEMAQDVDNFVIRESLKGNNMKIQEWYTGEPSSLEYGRAIDAGRKKLKDKYYPFDVDLWYGNTSSSLNSTGWIICLEFGRGDCYQWIAQKPSTTFGSKELTLYGPMDLDKGEYVETVFDLAEYKDKEVNKFKSIEQIMSYLFTNFSHLRDDDLDEGVDMKILKESSSYCWYAKYFDMKGNKKFVYLPKDITQDAEEAEEMMQEMIREPFTKFVFIGSGYIDTVVDELNATLLESTWSPVEYDEETGEYYSRPGNEFDGIDPQTQPIEEARMSRDPYGINDVKRLLNNKAPEAWWWREEIEMDFGDGSKLANYLTKKGIDVKYNEEDERWFVKGKYNFGDCYFYPYPYRYENELNEGLQYIESINSRKGIRAPKTLTETYHINDEEVMNKVAELGKELESQGFKYVSSKDSRDYYDFYRKIEDGKGIWKAIIYNYGAAEIIDVTYEQARGIEPIDSLEQLRKDLGKMLLPEGMSPKEGDKVQMDYYAKPNNGQKGTCTGRSGELCFITWDDGSKSKEIKGYLKVIDDVNESMNEALGRDYSHIPEVKQINYSNNKNGNLLPYLDCNAFKAALEETGLQAFKIKSARLKGVSLGDLKDEFGGRGMQPWKWTHDFDSSIPMGDGNEFDIFWKGEFPNKIEEDFNSDNWLLIKDSHMYDPEGLNINTPESILCKGSKEECINQFNEIVNSIKLKVAKDRNSRFYDSCGPSILISAKGDLFIKVYYPNAAAYEVYQVLPNTIEEKLQNEKEDTSEEKEDAKLNEEVEVPTLEGPNEGAEYGLSELLNSAIQHELETVNEYNVLALNARAEGFDDIASVIDEINTEENKHIGQLQELLKTISPNAQAIVAGETEASDDLVSIEESFNKIPVITFKGKRTFDTEEEAWEFKKSLGDKYRSITKVEYPDMTFYIVDFEED